MILARIATYLRSTFSIPRYYTTLVLNTLFEWGLRTEGFTVPVPAEVVQASMEQPMLLPLIPTSLANLSVMTVPPNLVCLKVVR